MVITETQEKVILKLCKYYIIKSQWEASNEMKPYLVLPFLILMSNLSWYQILSFCNQTTLL